MATTWVSGIELYAEAPRVIGGLRLAQAVDAARGRIAVGARLAERLLELLQHMGRRRQVRIAHAEVDDVGTRVPRGRLGLVDLFEHVRRQTADAVEIFHWSQAPGTAGVAGASGGGGTRFRTENALNQGFRASSGAKPLNQNVLARAPGDASAVSGYLGGAVFGRGGWKPPDGPARRSVRTGSSAVPRGFIAASSRSGGRSWTGR